MRRGIKFVVNLAIAISMVCSQVTSILAEEEVDSVQEIEEMTEDIQESPELEEPVETNDEDCLLNYLCLSSSSILLNEEQIIAISMNGEVESIRLTVEHEGKSFEMESINHIDSLYEFRKGMNEEGQYDIAYVTYEKEGEETTLDLSSIGINASFFVNKPIDKDSLPVAQISTDSSQEATEEIGVAIEEALEQTDSLEEISMEQEGNNTLTICIDPGHGGVDSGAIGINNVYERDLNLKISNYLKSYLEEYANVKVVMTRTDNSTNPSLSQRAEIAASYGSNLFVSIHLNALNGYAKGAEVYYPNSNYRPDLGEQGYNVATNIQSELVALGIANRGTKIRIIDSSDSEWQEYAYPDGSYADYYGVIRHCKKKGIAGIIVEHCYIDNYSDYTNYLNSDAKLQKLALADCEGIVSTYNLVKKGKNNLLEGYTLSLDGRIGINLYMSLSETTANDTSAYMKFTYADGTTSKVYVKNAAKKTIDGQQYYVFPCYVSAKNMTENIKAQLIEQEEKGEVYSVSVKSYGEYILNHTSKYSNEEIAIVKSLLNYGTFVQKYFGYNTGNLPTNISSLSSISVSSYKKSIVSKGNVNFVGARLVLKSTLGIKLYFSGTGDFYVNGTKVEKTTEGKYTVFTIDSINPVNLNKVYTITCGNFEMKYSALSYVYDTQNSSNSKLVQLGRSLYDYYQSLQNEKVSSLTARKNEEGYTYIMGSSHTTVQEMANYYKKNSSRTFDTFVDSSYNGLYAQNGVNSIESLCQIYYEEAKAEGVNAEVAFAQAILETGWFGYGGDVKPNQFNFAGLGATGGGNPGNSFSDIRTGIRAQIQHLKCYASTEDLVNPLVDQRWTDYLRGKAIYVEYLQISNNPYGTGWAASTTYATNLLDIIESMVN